MTVMKMSVADIGEFLRAEHGRWSKLAKDIGVVPE